MNLIYLYSLVYLALICFSAFFASAEVAYTSLSLNQLKRLRKSHPGMFRFWERSPNRVLATLMIANNAMQIAMGVLSADLTLKMTRLYGWSPTVTALSVSLITGTIVLFVGEILPKILARQYTVSWAIQVTPVFVQIHRLLNPLSIASLAIARIFLKRPLKRFQSPFRHRTHLRRILKYSQVPYGSQKLLNNVLDYETRTVKDIMVSRDKIFAVSIHQPLTKIIQNVIQSGYSRVPVYGSSLDQLLGLLYAKDLMVAWRSRSLVMLADLLRPVHYVAGSIPASDLLRRFKAGHQHMAFVRSETPSKKLEGLVTLQDALYMLVGPLKEEKL